MTLINTAGQAGQNAYSTVHSILGQSTHIHMTPESTVLNEMTKYGITIASLRKGSQRQRNEDNFRRLMRALDLEVMLIQDVFGNGNKLQLVIIGPHGNQLSDIRRDIRRGQISQEEAVGMLRQIFIDAVPDVRAFREQRLNEVAQQEPEPPARQPVVTRDPDPPPPPPSAVQREDDIRAQVLKQRQLEEGLITRRYHISTGLVTGHRNMHLSTLGDFQLRHASPFMGFGLHFDSIFQVLSRGAAGIGSSLMTHYAPFKTQFGNTMLASSYLRVAADIYYARDIASLLVARGYVGGELLSVNVASNAVYTGSRYINARAGLGVNAPATKWVNLDLLAGVVPVFDAENSGGAYGSSAFSFGYEVKGSVAFNILDYLDLSASYGFQSMPTTYPEPPANSHFHGSTINSTDALHTFMVSLGYKGKY